MAHKKAGGTAVNLKDSPGQRLGVKLFAGEYARSGAIVVRQRGTRVRAGKNVKKGKDDTLYATNPGFVVFRNKKRRRFDGSMTTSKFVDVIPNNPG